jgi:ABC-2 type transport system permease protein
VSIETPQTKTGLAPAPPSTGGESERLAEVASGGSRGGGERPNAMAELVKMRFRALFREPSIFFWVFVFPLLTTTVLGLAFRNRGAADVEVAVVEGANAAEVASALESAEGMAAKVVPRSVADERLRRGDAALVVIPGDPPELISDPTLPEGRAARLLAVDALERTRGRRDVGTYSQKAITTPGRRYVDFLIPGLLGFGLMSSAIWGLGWGIVMMRTGKLLKRFAATPMRRSDFLLSFVFSRSAFAIVEVLFFVGFARLLFNLSVQGSLLLFLGFGLLGSLSFSGVALLVASRAQNTETANGLMNVVTMPMMVLSGVFFSAHNFPQVMQPFLRILPLTALIDALRAVMLEGKGAAALGFEALVLAVWGVGSFVLSLRLFRWI